MVICVNAAEPQAAGRVYLGLVYLASVLPVIVLVVENLGGEEAMFNVSAVRSMLRRVSQWQWCTRATTAWQLRGDGTQMNFGHESWRSTTLV